MQGLEGMFRTAVNETTGIRHVVVRNRTCLCGARYEQWQLSSRFMELCEHHGKKAVDAVMADIPDLWVPVHCPVCERRDLTRHAPVEPPVMREPMRLGDKQRFAENMARLFGAWNRPNDEPTVRAYWKALEFAVSDEQFERGVLLAIRNERRWPTAAAILQLLKAA